MNNKQKYKPASLLPLWGAEGLLKTTIMKKLYSLLALLLLLATSCATSSVSHLTPDPSPKARGETPPPSEGDGGRLYLTGNDEPAASSNYSEQVAVEASHELPVGSGQHDLPAPPMYYTGNDEPAAYGLFISE
jgi:hypothetical protein